MCRISVENIHVPILKVASPDMAEIIQGVGWWERGGRCRIDLNQSVKRSREGKY
jgi:hypothetical protein